jgi:glucose/arabinose dehydrogenase
MDYNLAFDMRAWSPLALLAVAAAVITGRGDGHGAAAIALPPDFSDALVASVGSPTALAFTPDGRMLITTQTGLLRVYEGTLLTMPALDLSSRVCTESERGLLGVAVDPGFGSNGFVYLYYTADDPGDCVNRLSRFTMSGNTVSPASESILIDNIPSEGGNHNGGDVHVGGDGHLYVAVGDGGCDYEPPHGCGGANDAARDMNALLGKILRITREGGIPDDNPFQGVRCNMGTASAGEVCREIFATGLRNPFRVAFDPNAPGTVFRINDVGQNAWEEIDVGISGADYGWNVREGHCAEGSTTDCGPPPLGMTNPIFDYDHAGGCRAITGGAFVPEGVWPSSYDGTYLFADFVCGTIFRLDPVPGGYERSEFATGLGSNSAVSMTFGPFGGTKALYYTTYEGGGAVRRIAYTGDANRGPVARDDALAVSEDLALRVPAATLLANDTDADGDALSVAVVSSGPDTHGSVTLAGGEVLYTSTADFNGPARFGYTVSDGSESSTGSVTVAVAPVNDPPAAVPDVATARADVSVLVDVLRNDTPGPADESGQVLRLAGVGVPLHGTVVPAAGVNAGKVLYTPARVYNGPDSFAYTVCDSGQPNQCSSGLVRFSFSALPRPINLRRPRVVGGAGARAGSIVSADPGRWNTAPRAVVHRWLRCPLSGRPRCVPIRRATGRRYRLAVADVGRALRVHVTVRNRFGPAGSTSAPSRPVRSPVVIGVVKHFGDDWVVLTNETRLAVALRGWSLASAGRVVRVLGGMTIRPRRVLKVDTADVLGARGRVTLRLPGGRTADTCAYSTPRSRGAIC